MPGFADDFRAYLATATGFGTIDLSDGQTCPEVKHCTIATEH